MKIVKSLLIMLIILPLFSSCDFVEWIPNNDFDLSSEKDEYCNKLKEISWVEAYDEEERTLYLEYLIEGQSKINEAETYDEIVIIYEKYFNLISNLKTSEEYTYELANTKTHYLELLNSISKEDNYYEDELLMYKAYIEYGTSTINNINVNNIAIFDKIIETFEGYILDIKTKAEYKQEEIALQEKKANYINQIDNLIDIENYRDKEKELINNHILNAENLINSLLDINDSNFDKILEAYKKLFQDIKTDEQYLEEELIILNTYKELNINIIEKYCDFDIYRIEEQNLIREYINTYSNLITGSTDSITIDNYVREFKIKVYSLKTDSEYYQEELTSLINDSILYIKSYVNINDYRPEEKIILNQVYNTYPELCNTITTKEDIDVVQNVYVELIKTLKTDKQYYQEELNQMINDYYSSLLNELDTSNMGDEEVEEYYNYCQNIKDEMNKMDTKENVLSYYNEVVKDMYILGAQLGDLASLEKYKSIIEIEVNNYLSIDLYREEERNDISSILNNYKKELSSNNNYDDINSLTTEVKLKLDNVLSNNELWLLEDKQFLEDLTELFGTNILEKPKSLTEASNYTELANIIDYYAFYQLDSTSFVRNKFRVKLNYKYNTAEYEKNEVYWYCSLISGAVGIDAYFDIDDDYIVFELIPYDFASISNRNSTSYLNKKDYLCDFDSNATLVRSADFDDFNYRKNSKAVVVWNSQQLMFALEHDYVPLPVEGSTAELLLNVSKDILREIIKDDMDDIEKIFRIYEWTSNNIQYDYQAYNYNNSSDMNKYPCENYSKLNSVQLEGGLLDGLCICSGYTKTYLTLLKIEGITAKRIIARSHGLKGINTINSRDYGGGGFGFHEFIYIEINGKWYYSDPERACLEENGIYHSNFYLLTSVNYQNYGFTIEFNDMNFSDSIYNDVYDKIIYNNINRNDYESMIKLFADSNLSNSEISMILSSETAKTIIEDIISNYNNLNYIVHYNSKKKDICELIIIIDN